MCKRTDRWPNPPKATAAPFQPHAFPHTLAPQMLQSLGIEQEMCGKKAKRPAEKKDVRARANPFKRGRLGEFSLWGSGAKAVRAAWSKWPS